ncbi:hypothetical protein F5887DRAFT_154577 [Amanita rubescens]|nr:hypothetical protein F5887DRAFT_154577 [Amanita rubescens]
MENPLFRLWFTTPCYLSSKLYRPGSVVYVSKSGGMSNELNNTLSLVTDGTLTPSLALGYSTTPRCAQLHASHPLGLRQTPGKPHTPMFRRY